MKEQQETEERQQQWKQKERKARKRLRRKKREKEMQPLTEYGYKIPGFEHPAKSAMDTDGLTEDPDDHSGSPADRNASGGRGRSAGSDGGRTTDSPSHRHQHDRPDVAIQSDQAQLRRRPLGFRGSAAV